MTLIMKFVASNKYKIKMADFTKEFFTSPNIKTLLMARK